MEEPSHDYDHKKFENVGATEKFSLISKNRSFNKEKGFHHPEDFFSKTITSKGLIALYQPPTLVATMVVREFYAKQATSMLKKVKVR